MKFTRRPALLLLVASPGMIFASSVTDRKIEDAARATYNYRTFLHQQVQVQSNDGVVTLTGTVADHNARALAADTVEHLPGVTQVKNALTLKPTTSASSNAWMAFKIRSRLLVKRDVSLVTTTIAMNDGAVTLGGTARNPAQKELTGIYAAEIAGVKSVTNNIVVAGHRDTAATRPREAHPSSANPARAISLPDRPPTKLRSAAPQTP